MGHDHISCGRMKTRPWQFKNTYLVTSFFRCGKKTLYQFSLSFTIVAAATMVRRCRHVNIAQQEYYVIDRI